jgi:hypothetical protein
VRLAPSGLGGRVFYPGRLDYGCSRPLTKALSTLGRWPAARIVALDLKRRFGALGFWWLNHDASPACHADRRPQSCPAIAPSACASRLSGESRRTCAPSGRWPF